MPNDITRDLDGLDLPVFHTDGRMQAIIASQEAAPLPTHRQAMQALTAVYGAMLYAFTFGPYVKLGWTEHLDQRAYQLRSQAIAEGYDVPQILGFKPGTRAEELELHRGLATSVHHGREWYHPTPEVLAVINDWREAVGRQPVAA